MSLSFGYARTSWHNLGHPSRRRAGRPRVRRGAGRRARLYLGDPEDVSEDLLGPDPSVAWYYWDLGVSAHFSGEDGFLGEVPTGWEGGLVEKGGHRAREKPGGMDEHGRTGTDTGSRGFMR